MAVAAQEVFSLNDKKVVELFLQAKKLQNMAQGSLKGYQLELYKFITFAEKNGKSVLNFTPADIRLYLAEYPNIKPASMSRKIAVLKSFYKFLVNEDYLQSNVMDKIDAPKLGKALPKFLTLEELDALRKVCKSNRDRAILEMMYSTGVRLSELQQLNQEDINWQHRKIIVTGKGDKQRVIGFSERAEKYLKKYLNNRNDNDNSLFLSQRKKRISIRGIQHIIESLGEQAGLRRKLHPHLMRHTMASQAVQHGVDLQAVSIALGHSSYQVTQRYAHLTNEYVDKEFTKMPT